MTNSTPVSTLFDPKTLNNYLGTAINLVPENIRNYIDNAATNYLRNTTTDQEILDFYGEGNIIGRKGIPDLNNKENEYKFVNDSLDVADAGKKVRPQSIDPRESRQRDSLIVDIPNSNSPQSSRPWQMKFTNFNIPKSGGLTPAAEQFLNDFRVPTHGYSDYSFEVSPNVEDVKTKMIETIINNPGSYKNSSLAYKGKEKNLPTSEWGEMWNNSIENINKYQNIESGIIRFDGEITTPKRWAQEGFLVPDGLKDNTLSTFKQQIMLTEKPFGSVSSLTPVSETERSTKPGGDPDWRANLYEKQGLAGPMTEITIPSSGGWDGTMSDNIQMFTRGKERLLPIQPRSEFLNPKGPYWNKVSKPSILQTAPAPDFTPLQTAVGPRNYLIGRNLLEGRGAAGQALVRSAKGAGAALQVGALDLIPSPEVIRQLGENPNNPAQAATTFAQEFAAGVPVAAGIGAATAAVPALGNIIPPVVGGLALINTGQTANQVYKQATGKDWITRNQPRPFVSTTPSETPQLVGRMGTAILNGKEIKVPWGSVAGIEKVGRPWWDTVGTPIRRAVDAISTGSALSPAGGNTINGITRPVRRSATTSRPQKIDLGNEGRYAIRQIMRGQIPWWPK